MCKLKEAFKKAKENLEITFESCVIEGALMTRTLDTYNIIYSDDEFVDNYDLDYEVIKNIQNRIEENEGLIDQMNVMMNLVDSEYEFYCGGKEKVEDADEAERIEWLNGVGKICDPIFDSSCDSMDLLTRVLTNLERVKFNKFYNKKDEVAVEGEEVK